MKPTVLAVLFCVGIFPFSAKAIVIDNGMPDTEDDVTGWISDFAANSQIGDDFSLNTAGVFNRLQWWGGYSGGSEEAVEEDDFTIRIFDINAGIPADIPFFTYDAGHVTRSFTRLLPIGGGIPEYEFVSFFPDLVLQAGDYLLSVVNNTVLSDFSAPDDSWHWHTSALTGNAWRWDTAAANPDWKMMDEEFAFNLARIPEPNTLLLFLIGLSGLLISYKFKNNEIPKS